MQILIVGAHRSGTSAMAGILHHLGVDMGPMAPPHASHPESNPLGQFEDDRFVQIFNEMIGNWRDPVIPNTLPTELVKRFEYLIAERNARFPVWGLKTPQLCFTASFMISKLDDPLVVCIDRDFDEVVASLIARDGYHRAVAEYIVSRYRIAWDGFTGWASHQDFPLALGSYNKIVTEPAYVVREFAAVLGVTDEEKILRAIAHIRPELRHHGGVPVEALAPDESEDEDVLPPPATESSGLFDPLDSQAPTTA